MINTTIHYNTTIMKLKYIFVSVLSFVFTQTNAEDKASATNYFIHSLQNDNAGKALHQRISAKQVMAKRHELWQAWKEANQKYNSLSLPYLANLSKCSPFSWQLPDSLEPNAKLNFYFGYKDEMPKQGYPLFIYLHGSGPKQQEWQTGLVLAQRFKDAPSAYFIPQIPNEGEWYRWWQKSKQYAWQTLLRNALLSDSINANQLYVFGISEGGYGSQRLASYYADYWAAAGPMAGGEPLKNAPTENLQNIGFSLRTGANDTGFYRNLLTRYTQESLDSLENLNPAGYRHKVVLEPNCQHFIDYSQTTPWLLHFTRNPYPLHFVWEDFEMDGLHRTGFYNLKVIKRPDAKLRTRYDVSISNNEVDIVVENVNYETTERDPMYGIELKFNKSYTIAHNGAFTLYLDEHLVNLSDKVIVKVNGKEVYNKRLQLDIKNMQESIATFYDPKRIYPAAINITY